MALSRAPAPPELDILTSTVVRPAGKSNGDTRDEAERTPLSAFDQTIVATAIGRVAGFPTRIDPNVLEVALRATLDDLPFLAGRLGGMKGVRSPLGALYIAHTGDGVPLTVAEAPGTSLADVGPDSWPQTDCTIADPHWPWYLERMDVGRRLLSGKEPLMRVRLSQLRDGSLLGITFAHVVTGKQDGTRWPAFAAHLAARYSEAAGGGAAPGANGGDTARLLRPCDRRLLSVEGMRAQLLGNAAWSPPPLKVRGSLLGYWRLLSLLASNARQRVDQLVLHLPAQQVAALKALAAEGNSVAGITTGDAVQAAAALLMHAAQAKPLLPVAPKVMAVLVQMPAPPGYFGNAARMLKVSLPAGSAQPAAGDYADALRTLAGAIHEATASFRSDPEAALAALADSEALAAAPAPAMLAFLAGTRLPLHTCTTNYVPRQEAMDLGLGRPATLSLELTYPRARDMAVIRGAAPPYSEGLFLHVSLARTDAARLRGHPVLAALVPGAAWVGAR